MKKIVKYLFNFQLNHSKINHHSCHFSNNQILHSHHQNVLLIKITLIFFVFVYNIEMHMRDTDKIFFQKIDFLFTKITDKKYQTLKWAVNNIIKIQWKYLTEFHNSKKKASKSSYIQIIDEWIKIVDEWKTLKQEQKNVQELKNQKTETLLNWHANNLKLFFQKNQFNKRKYQQFKTSFISENDDSLFISEFLIFFVISTSSRHKKSWKSKISRLNIPKNFHHFMNAYKKCKNNFQIASNTQLKNKIIKIESKISDLKKNINNILNLLKNESWRTYFVLK